MFSTLVHAHDVSVRGATSLLVLYSLLQFLQSFEKPLENTVQDVIIRGSGTLA